ncbi:MAG TPA: spermidine synthase [Myxococcota bacterium]|nr:spermidine synthase [Myxococcota bacterium]
MTRPWTTLECVATPRGELCLRRRGASDFLIALDGRVIMTSAAHRSESLLAEAACAELGPRKRPHVLVAGLGMGYSLRAALDRLPRGARVDVSELEAAVVAWCRGPLAALTGDAQGDPRVRVRNEDVSHTLARAARGESPRYDAILLDLYEGPGGDDDPVFGSRGLSTLREALAAEGVLAVWSERPDPRFEKRLRSAGFRSRRAQSRGALRHAVTLARPASVRAARTC